MKDPTQAFYEPGKLMGSDYLTVNQPYAHQKSVNTDNKIMQGLGKAMPQNNNNQNFMKMIQRQNQQNLQEPNNQNFMKMIQKPRQNNQMMEQSPQNKIMSMLGGGNNKRNIKNLI